jgi:phospholipid-binding lipoprotein MlaA
MKTQRFSLWLALLALIGIAGVATLSAQTGNVAGDESIYYEEIDESIEVYDPLESINRATFAFNDFVYMNLLDPFVDLYTAVTPDPIEEGAENFFDNLRYPVRLAGNLLQGKFDGAWVETGRFAINSTLGIVGVMTPADNFESFQPVSSEDVGQALGIWGFDEGAFIVLPFLGPSNVRDLCGLIGDRAANPLKEPFSLIDDWDWEWQLSLSGGDFISKSPTLMKQYKSFNGGAIDPYSSMKNGYTQFRRAAIAD